MTILMLLLALVQAPPADARPTSLPAEVVQSLLKAAEGVAAIAQSGVLCQAQKSSEDTRVAAIRKERLENQNRIAGLEKTIDLQKIAQQGKSSGSTEYRRAAAEIVEAREIVGNIKRHLSDLTARETESVGKLKDHDACIGTARKQLESLKAARSTR